MINKECFKKFLASSKLYQRDISETFNDLIKKEFDGLSAVFILPKLRKFILNIYPEYLKMQLDKEDEKKEFEPVFCGFRLKSIESSFKEYPQIMIWELNEISISWFKNKELNYNFYEIKSREKKESFIPQSFILETTLYLGSIPNHPFGEQLLKNLGITK